MAYVTSVVVTMTYVPNMQCGGITMRAHEHSLDERTQARSLTKLY